MDTDLLKEVLDVVKYVSQNAPWIIVIIGISLPVLIALWIGNNRARAKQLRDGINQFRAIIAESQRQVDTIKQDVDDAQADIDGAIEDIGEAQSIIQDIRNRGNGENNSL